MAKMIKKKSVAELLLSNRDKSCANCVFFVDEHKDWNGVCELRRTPIPRHRSDRACAFFKELRL